MLLMTFTSGLLPSTLKLNKMTLFWKRYLRFNKQISVKHWKYSSLCNGVDCVFAKYIPYFTDEKDQELVDRLADNRDAKPIRVVLLITDKAVKESGMPPNNRAAWMRRLWTIIIAPVPSSIKGLLLLKKDIEHELMHWWQDVIKHGYGLSLIHI